MDPIDLFIGSEGTLGVVTAGHARASCPSAQAQCLALVPFTDRKDALAFVRRLRDEAIATRRSRSGRVSTSRPSSTWTPRCLALLREDGLDRANGVHAPAREPPIALLVTLGAFTAT